jgi:hypothetical protein
MYKRSFYIGANDGCYGVGFIGRLRDVLVGFVVFGVVRVFWLAVGCGFGRARCGRGYPRVLSREGVCPGINFTARGPLQAGGAGWLDGDGAGRCGGCQVLICPFLSWKGRFTS